MSEQKKVKPVQHEAAKELWPKKDVPSFLNVSQIIAGYTFTGTGGAVLNTLPDPGGPKACRGLLFPYPP